MPLKSISFVTILVSAAQGADILAVSLFPSYSHQVAYTHLWKELSLRGHKVTAITTNPLKDINLTNLTEIDMNWSYKYGKDISSEVVENTLTMWNVYDVIYDRIRNLSKVQLRYPPVQDLIHNRTNFDLVLVDLAYPEFLAFAEIYKCPKIIFSSMEVNLYFHRAIGNPSHPILHPDSMTPFYSPLTFKERIISTLYSWYLSYAYAYKFIPDTEKMAQEFFNITTNIEEVVKNVDMMFVSINPIIQGVRAIGPTTINIGGHRKPISSKPLPKDLQKFLDNAKDGFIYFSLGSNVKSKDLNEQSLKSIIESLREMPYKVLWKFEADELPGKPDNVQLVKWAPQEDVLAHPNIKLFVTQGGLQSMEEAIYSAVPLVVIPFFADQGKNANLMVAKGIARIVDRKPFIRKDDLRNAMMEVINNPSYKNSVQRLKQLALDTPMTGLEQAVWWTEYVIRNKGAKHLRNPAADLPLYQYYLIDVISFLVISIILVLSTVIVLAKILFKVILRVFKYGNSLSDKKLQ